MAPISFVIDILLRWVMMLRTRMTRRSGGCRWRSNVGETRRRCGRRDRDWSCRVMVWLTQPAPQTNLPAWGYSDTDCDEDFLEAEAETVIIKFTDTLTEWSAECIALALLSQMGSGRLSLVDQVPWLVSREMLDQDYHVTEIRSTLTWPRPTPDCPHGPEHPGQLDPGSQRLEVYVCCVSLVSLPR